MIGSVRGWLLKILTYKRFPYSGTSIMKTPLVPLWVKRYPYFYTTMSGGRGNAYLCHVADIFIRKDIEQVEAKWYFPYLKTSLSPYRFSIHLPFNMAACMQKYAEIVAVMMSDAIPLLCLMGVHSKGGAKNNCALRVKIPRLIVSKGRWLLLICCPMENWNLFIHRGWKCLLNR